MRVIEEARDFDLRHGGNPVLNERHMILLPDGAQRENSQFGAWMEPATDPWERSKAILDYHECRLRKAMFAFDEWRLNLERHCEASLRSGNPPPADSDLERLEKLREVVRVCRAAVADASLVVDANKPIALIRREEAAAENRASTAEFQDKLARVKV